MTGAGHDGSGEPSVLPLRYGINPHQQGGRALVAGRDLPFRVLHGAPSYTNLLDALNGWQLVRELRAHLGLPAAASFKHVSPAGAAVAVPLNHALGQAYQIGDRELSPLATAYARARGADRVSSFGDFIAVSDPVDESTAALIAAEVSDGIIAPGYEPGALARLRSKKQGAYLILEIDPGFTPDAVERRTVFGITLEQRRNDQPVGFDLLANRVTRVTELPEPAQRDLVLAMVTLKYTQSNSVCLTLDGQVIGCGAGQQSRIHCTRLAAGKADRWYLGQHPAVLGLAFKANVARSARDNAIDQFLAEDTTDRERAGWDQVFDRLPAPLTSEQKRVWLDGLRGVAMGSDGYFPFDDSIHRAAASGVRYIVQPGGSVRDDAVIRTCDAYGMTMAFSGVRLFHH